MDPRVHENPRPGVKAKDSDDEGFSHHSEFLKAAAIILNSEHNNFARAPEHVSGEVPPPTDEAGGAETREYGGEALFAEPTAHEDQMDVNAVENRLEWNWLPALEGLDQFA